MDSYLSFFYRLLTEGNVKMLPDTETTRTHVPARKFTKIDGFIIMMLWGIKWWRNVHDRRQHLMSHSNVVHLGQ